MLDYDRIKRSAVIKSYQRYPKGANCPTCFEEYSCPCGKGIILREYVPGFEDDFMTLKCRRCLNTYAPFVDPMGDQLTVYIRKK